MQTKTQIKKINGIPRLFINNRIVAPITYNNRGNDLYDYMKQFADSGTELFFCHHERKKWQESWDQHFEKIKRRLDITLAFNDRIYAFIGIYLSVSQEWARANPDELCRENGKPCVESAKYSFASEKFDEVAREQINRTLDFLDTYPLKHRVIGMFFGAGSTAEWNPFTPDQGPRALDAFRNYLESKYVNVARFRKAWKDPAASFDKVTEPSASEKENTALGYYHVPYGPGQKAVDWKLALADAKSRRMLNAARAIKDRRPDMLTGCFLGNHYTGAGVMQKILESDAIDFLASPPQYHARCPGQHMELNQVVDSLHAYGKLFISEEDVRAFDTSADYLKKMKHQPLPYQGDAKNIDETLAVYEKGLGNTIARGTMSWYFHFSEEFFRREKKYFKMNRMMTDISMLNIKHKCRSNAQILVVCDEQSLVWMKPASRVIQKQVDRQLTFEFGYTGAPYEVMLIDSLDHPDVDLSKYKLVFFLNSHIATARQRKIVEKLKSSGRTIVFGHGSGFLSDTGASVENMKDFTSFDFEMLDIEHAATVTMIDTPNPVNRYLPTGYTFGQSYRAKRLRADTKGNALFPPPANAAPIFAVADRKSIDIGFYNLEMPADYRATAATGAAFPYGLASYPAWPRYFVGMALKEHKNWNAIYVGTTTLPSALLRAICKYAGVHLYLESDDVLYCNNKFMVLHSARESGIRTVKFPRKTDVYDLKQNKKLASGVKNLEVDCPARGTRLLWLDNKPPFK